MINRVMYVLIAAGLWANAAAGYFQKAQAQDNTQIEYQIRTMAATMQAMQSDINDIAHGTCANSKVC